MGADADFTDYLHARWPVLVAALEAQGVGPDEARLAVAEVLVERRRGWDRLVEEEEVDHHVWQALRDRTGLPPRPSESVPVARTTSASSGPLMGDGPEPWLARATEARRGRRGRTVRRSLLVLAGLVVVLGGIAWWDARPQPPAVREEANPLPVIWYAGDQLHLEDVVVELPDVSSFVAHLDGAAVRRVSGEVVHVDGDGEVSPLDEAPAGLDFAPDMPDYLPFGRYTFVVDGAPTADGGWAYVLDSRRGASDALRLSEAGQRVLVLCDAAGVCRQPDGGMPGGSSFRLR